MQNIKNSFFLQMTFLEQSVKPKKNAVQSTNLLFLKSVLLKLRSSNKWKKIHDIWHLITLLPISEFVLDDMFQWNASKFAIFYIYKNTKLLFPYLILCYFFLLPGLCWHRPGHLLGNKINYSTKWKMEKATLGFCIYKIWQILKPFTGSFHQA